MGNVVMDARRDLRFFVVKNKINFKDRQYTILGWVTFTNDPTKNPKQFEARTYDGKTYKGIYQLKGNELLVRVCDREGEAMPRDFSPEDVSHDDLYVLKRAKAD
jgi:uncharacterized protein (TIGR03067 family)